jgi:hypothetical protein
MFLTSLPGNINAPNIYCSDIIEKDILNIEKANQVFCEPPPSLSFGENCYLDEVTYVRCDPVNYSVGE